MLTETLRHFLTVCQVFKNELKFRTRSNFSPPPQPEESAVANPFTIPRLNAGKKSMTFSHYCVTAVDGIVSGFLMGAERADTKHKDHGRTWTLKIGSYVVIPQPYDYQCVKPRHKYKLAVVVADFDKNADPVGLQLQVRPLKSISTVGQQTEFVSKSRAPSKSTKKKKTTVQQPPAPAPPPELVDFSDVIYWFDQLVFILALIF